MLTMIRSVITLSIYISTGFVTVLVYLDLFFYDFGIYLFCLMVYVSYFFVALLLSLMPLVKICSIYLHCHSDYTYIDFCVISVPVNGRCFFKKNFIAPLDGVPLPQGYRATTRRQFAFYQSVPRSSWSSFHQPRKDERLSRPWSHPVV